MAYDNEFDTYREQPVAEKKGIGCLKGCLIVLSIVAVLVILGSIWLAYNWRGVFSSAATGVIERGIDESQLPAQEKIELKQQVTRLSEAFESGEVSGQQMGQILEQLAQSPLMASMIVSQVETHYLARSGLTEEEKLQGKVDLHRFVRGLFSEKIDRKSLDEVLEPIGEKQTDGSWKLQENVSDQQLRTMLAVAKEKADAAEIPAQVEQPDPSEELKRIIDEALAEP